MATETPSAVVDVTDQNFAQAVLEESGRRPVVVDFWAAWCQPCRIIGPILDRLAEEYAGRFVLGKLNSIRQFIETILPSEADALSARAEAAERAGRTEEAEGLYRQALALDPHHAPSELGLGRAAAMRGDLDEARRLLTPLRPDPEAERLLAAVDVSEWGASGADGEGPLAAAERAAEEGRFQEALDVFLAAIRNGMEEDRRSAREAMLKLFAVLGDDDPLTQEYRRRLASALF